MDGFALLCDFAEVINGKLYVMGGCWTDVIKMAPLTFALAAKIDVPYDRTNERLFIDAKLLDLDGHQVRLQHQDIAVQATLEAGRPPGIKKGAPILVPLAWKFVGLDLPVGAYEFRIMVEQEDVARVPFTVHNPPQMPQGLPKPEDY